MSDPSHFGGLDESDPKSMARFMKNMGEAMGEDVRDDMEAALDEAGADGSESSATDID